jgi:hypothetical protein
MASTNIILPSRPNMFLTRQRINFGFGLQTFSKSYFGAPTSHGTRFGFGGFGFSRARFGTPGPSRGPTSSFARIDNYWGHVGRLFKRCIAASGELASEEIYWHKHMDNRTGCKPKPTKITAHCQTLRRAKINGITAYIYHQWKMMSDEDKRKFIERAKGKPVTGINIYLKEFFSRWGFGKNGFSRIKFGSYHYPLVFFGFSTVAFGMGAFGSSYPEPRRLGFGVQTFGEMRFGSNIRRERKIREFR